MKCYVTENHLLLAIWATVGHSLSRPVMKMVAIATGRVLILLSVRSELQIHNMTQVFKSLLIDYVVCENINSKEKNYLC